MIRRVPAFSWYAVSAGLAWLGLALSLTLNLTGFYASDIVTDPHSYGYAGGAATPVPSRLADWISYFTIWSNITVAAVATLLARRARKGMVGTPTLAVFRLSSLVMITITGLVYAVVLADEHAKGSVEFEFRGDNRRGERDVDAPYEAWVYPVHPDRDVPIGIKVTDATQALVGSAEMLLPK